MALKKKVIQDDGVTTEYIRNHNHIRNHIHNW